MDTTPIPQTTPPGAIPPKKYIRTFAGDIETVQKGGTPNLVPLQPPPKAAAEKAPPLPPPEVPVPVQVPEQINPPIPAPVPVISSLPMEEPATIVIQEGPKPTPLKTYSGDFSDRMEETHASTATILAAEQDSRPRTPQVTSPTHTTSRTSIVYVIAGIVLFIAGGVGMYIAYTKYLVVSVPVTLAPSVTAPIFVDDREPISGVGVDLAHAIEISVSRPLAPGAVRLLYLANTDVVGAPLATTTESVFSTLRLPAPDILLRNVNVDGSMAGVVNAGGSQTLFFILSVASYSNTFSGMLSWEAMMPRDVDALFSPFIAPVPILMATTSIMTATTSAETASTTQSIVIPMATSTPAAPVASTPAFRDAVVANHDVRIYRNAAGEDVLIYGYWNQTTLVIAHDASAFIEIIQRLATSRAQ